MTSRSDDVATDGTAAYEVGYGKPPKATQFKPGQSGNPRGKRRRPKSVPDQLAEILKRKVPITRNGRQRQVSMQEVMLTTLVNNAAKGDLRAFKCVIELQTSHQSADGDTIDLGLLGSESRHIISAFLEEHSESISQGDGGTESKPGGTNRGAGDDGTREHDA